jgi:hypothetical protein
MTQNTTNTDLESRISPVQLWRLAGSYESHKFLSSGQDRDEAYVQEVISRAEKFTPRDPCGYSAKCVVFYDDVSAYLFGLDIINDNLSYRRECPRTGHYEVKQFAIELMKYRYGLPDWSATPYKKGGGFITIDTKIPLIALHGKSETYGSFYEVTYTYNKDTNRHESALEHFPITVVKALSEYARDNIRIGSFHQLPRIFIGCFEPRLQYDSNGEVDLILKLMSKNLELHLEEDKT